MIRLFDWGKAAGHKAIVRPFQRLDQADSSRVQTSSFLCINSHPARPFGLELLPECAKGAGVQRGAHLGHQVQVVVQVVDA